jgi:APA family basic amino acid/polyamine antiporter
LSTRTISLFTATCIVVANMIGTGVFTSLGYQVGPLPSGFAILALWLLGGICALCGALSYGELAAALPRSGGEYHFLSQAYHPAAGFMAGWISITVGFAAPVALAAMAFGSYLQGAWPSADARFFAVALVILTTGVHLCGNRAGSWFQNGATTLKIALIAVLIIAGALVTNAQPVNFLPDPHGLSLLTSRSFAESLIYVMYAYTGWNATVYIISEIREPARTVPLSVTLGTLLVTAVYLLLNGIFLHAAPMSELARQQDVAHVAARHIFGELGGRIMSGLICIGLIASVSAMTWIGPRVSATMGEDWPALAALARRTGKGVPAIALLCQAAIVITLILTATFQAVLVYIQFSLTLCSFATVLAVFVLRARQPHLPRPYRTWGYPITPLIFLAVSGWMLWSTLRGKPTESLAGLATMALGLGVWALCPRRKMHR